MLERGFLPLFINVSKVKKVTAQRIKLWLKNALKSLQRQVFDVLMTSVIKFTRH